MTFRHISLTLALFFLSSGASFADGLMNLPHCAKKISNSALLTRVDGKLSEGVKLGQISKTNIKNVGGNAQPSSFCQAARDSVDAFARASSDAYSLIGKASTAVETLFSSSDDCVKELYSQLAAFSKNSTALNNEYGALSSCKLFPLKNGANLPKAFID